PSCGSCWRSVIRATSDTSSSPPVIPSPDCDRPCRSATCDLAIRWGDGQGPQERHASGLHRPVLRQNPVGGTLRQSTDAGPPGILPPQCGKQWNQRNRSPLVAGQVQPQPRFRPNELCQEPVDEVSDEI